MNGGLAHGQGGPKVKQGPPPFWKRGSLSPLSYFWKWQPPPLSNMWASGHSHSLS